MLPACYFLEQFGNRLSLTVACAANVWWRSLPLARRELLPSGRSRRHFALGSNHIAVLVDREGFTEYTRQAIAARARCAMGPRVFGSAPELLPGARRSARGQGGA